MINPKKFTQRDAINSLTGIKSSLGNLRKVVSLTYLLYLANKKKSSIVYAESKDGKIVLKQEYKSFIQHYLNNSEVIEKIDDNPLLTSQIESLYVGLTLMFAFGRISFENTSLSMTKERTGGIRYPKKIDFASNIMTLDLMLNSDSEEAVKATLLAWLQDKQLDNKIEQRISIFLNICIENNLFKLRHGEDDLYFQTEGIYKSLITGNEVSLESDEIVGPTRILNSMLRENLVPWLNFKKSLVTINADNDFNVKEYSDIISTSLSIRDIKVDNNIESAPKLEDTHNDDKELPLHVITNATLVDEMKLHHLYMKEFGISDEEVQNVRASLFNRTYTANMLATALKGDLAQTLATVFPCAWTYCDYGKRLKEQYKDTLENNFYKSWIETYSGAEFEESFEWFYDALDELVANKSEAEKKVVEDIFISSVEFEYMFWDMAYNKQMSYVKS